MKAEIELALSALPDTGARDCVRCYLVKAHDRIEELEAALREAREDDHVGGGLTTATVDRINTLIGPQSDTEAKS